MTANKMNCDKIVIGIDLGSVTAKIVFLNENREILESHYLRHKGHPGEVLCDKLADMFTRFPMEKVRSVGITGSGGKRVAPLLGAIFINEVIAETLAISRLYKGVRSIINIGGQDSKLIHLDSSPTGEDFIIENFTMNTLCAAGTGAFLDQQANRLGVKIEDEFGELAMKSVNPPRIAGRCSVFAKSDMIHLQQKGTSLEDILAGLCYAMARNFKATIGKNSPIRTNVAFIGGVARNKGVVKAFNDVLELKEGEMIIPEFNSLIGALGAAMNVFDRDIKFPGIESMRSQLAQITDKEDGFAPLKIREEHLISKEEMITFAPGGEKVNAYLGIDIGSISTNVVLVDESGRLIAKEYLRTGGQPIEAVKRGLREIGQDMGDQINVIGACTTGSARYLIGDFIGADLVKDEITAHARGARHVDPAVDTIFEIGGQDSKYIRLENGAIVDFEMNKVCAAGTGSFLEEQAGRLGVEIKDEFSSFALCAKDPSRCGERCTVFMESDLVHHQQKGVPKEDIVAGLAYSIVYNYINKVVEGRPIGNHVFLQGGVAFNKAVTAAFETVLEQPIIVPPHHEVMGAYGAALLVKDALTEKKSRFKGWDASEQEYKIKTFECHSCANGCMINRVTIGEDSVFYYGSRCDKYDIKKDDIKNDITDFYTIRDHLLRNSYPGQIEPGKGKGRVGIPLSMTIYEDFPLWKGFFTELGYEVVLSNPTNKSHISRGLETVVEETCFPIKVLHGHIQELVDMKVDFVFIPFMMDMWNDNPNIKEALLCAYVQTIPDLIRTAFRPEDRGVQVLSPIVKPSVGEAFVTSELHKTLGSAMKVSRKQVSKALKTGIKALDAFREAIIIEGEKALASIGDNEFAIGIISRPYNGPDRGINLDLPKKLNSLGVKVIPMDFLPLAKENIQDELPNMYWWFGHRALAATKIIRDNPKLYPIFINNFACGPDSFSLQYFLHMMGDKPNLVLEIDEHSADAGMMTRAEAFIDSIKFLRQRNVDFIKQDLPSSPAAADVARNILKEGKKLWLPPINKEHSVAIAAAFRASGIDCEVLPDTDEESLLIARKYTNNKECFPYIIITGDVIKLTQSPGFDAKKTAFFMPSGNGVCRLNHYESMQRLVLEKLGIPLDIYSPSAEKAMVDMGRVSARLPMDAWTATVASDCLFRAHRQTRPYEVVPGETDRVYRNARQMLVEAIENRQSVIPVMKAARKEFGTIKVDKSVRKPKIGIVGEYYVRWHAFSNNHVFDLIEKLGGEVVAPTMAENMLHFGHTTITDLGRKKKYGSQATMFVTNAWQEYQEHQIYHPFADFLEIYPEPKAQELEDLAAPYANEIIENEIVISLGKARWLLETHKISGIVNLTPFTCLLGTPISAMLKTLKEDYPDAAITTFKFDGAADVNIMTRLEAYMHQARQYLGNKKEAV
jgi:predicted CoA-substrate-specific enzyme activase